MLKLPDGATEDLEDDIAALESGSAEDPAGAMAVIAGALGAAAGRRDRAQLVWLQSRLAQAHDLSPSNLALRLLSIVAGSAQIAAADSAPAGLRADLSLSQQVLAAIAEGHRTNSELQKSLDRSVQHVSNVLGRLTEQGWIAASRSSQDGRVKLYSVTGDGWDYLERVRQVTGVDDLPRFCGVNLEDLRPGEIRRGVVTSIVVFGAFVDLGGVQGLVHVSELSHSWVENPEDVVRVGDEVAVMVLEVDLERSRVSLSLKKAEQPEAPELVPQSHDNFESYPSAPAATA